MKRALFVILSSLAVISCLSACSGLTNTEDPADKFVGTYNLSILEQVVWGGDSGPVNSTGTLSITKIGTTKVQTSGYFYTQGEVTGNAIYFEPNYMSDSYGYINEVFGAGSLSGNVLTFTSTMNGQLAATSGGTRYPFRASVQYNAIKQY